jgi:large conductance mechanosensitive channel
MAEKNRTSRTQKVKRVIVPAQALVTVSGGQVKGFLDFIRTQGVIGLAIGLVLGGAVGIVVKSLVDNVVMPPIGLLLGSGDGLKGLSWTIGEGDGGVPAIIHYGTFLNDVINFLVIALVIYFVFHLLGLTKLDKKKD